MKPHWWLFWKKHIWPPWLREKDLSVVSDMTVCFQKDDELSQKTLQLTNVGSLLSQRLRRWPNREPTLDKVSRVFWDYPRLQVFDSATHAFWLSSQYRSPWHVFSVPAESLQCKYIWQLWQNWYDPGGCPKQVYKHDAPTNTSHLIVD